MPYQLTQFCCNVCKKPYLNFDRAAKCELLPVDKPKYLTLQDVLFKDINNSILTARIVRIYHEAVTQNNFSRHRVIYIAHEKSSDSHYKLSTNLNSSQLIDVGNGPLSREQYYELLENLL